MHIYPIITVIVDFTVFPLCCSNFFSYTVSLNLVAVNILDFFLTYSGLAWQLRCDRSSFFEHICDLLTDWHIKILVDKRRRNADLCSFCEQSECVRFFYIWLTEAKWSSQKRPILDTKLHVKWSWIPSLFRPNIQSAKNVALSKCPGRLEQ